MLEDLVSLLENSKELQFGVKVEDDILEKNLVVDFDVLKMSVMFKILDMGVMYLALLSPELDDGVAVEDSRMGEDISLQPFVENNKVAVVHRLGGQSINDMGSIESLVLDKNKGPLMSGPTHVSCSHTNGFQNSNCSRARMLKQIKIIVIVRLSVVML